MGRYLIVGDLHCKMTLVLPRVTDIALANCRDNIIFTGDLCDDWHVSSLEMVHQLEYAAKWKCNTEELRIQPIFLLVNHDCAYLDMLSYFFTNQDVRETVGRILVNDLNVSFAATANQYLLTHAGVTRSWTEAHDIEPGMSADE